MNTPKPHLFFETTSTLSRWDFVTHLMGWALGSMVLLGMARVVLVVCPMPALLFSTWLFLSAYTLATLCLQRLNDLNRSGWWLALVLVPMMGSLLLSLGLLCLKSSAADH